MTRSRSIAIMMSTLMGLSLAGGAPVAAQDPVECVGGSSSYWKDPAHAWPVFAVPKRFTRRNSQPVTIRRSTRFDRVFRFRRPRHNEGRILPGKTLRQVVKHPGGGLDGLARHAVAALLNSAATNDFWTTKGEVIELFQVYWDGTDDMAAPEARRALSSRFKRLNQQACPAPVLSATALD